MAKKADGKKSNRKPNTLVSCNICGAILPDTVALKWHKANDHDKRPVNRNK